MQSSARRGASVLLPRRCPMVLGFCALVVLWGCRQDGGGIRRDTEAIAFPDGALVEFIEVRSVPVPPSQDALRAAVSFDGTVAVMTNGDPAVALFGPDLSNITMVGKKGSGPGEFTAAAGYSVFSGNTLYVQVGSRIVSIARSGDSWQAASWAIEPSYQLLSVTPDSADFWEISAKEGFPILRLGIRGNAPRRLLGAADSFYKRLVTPLGGEQGEPRRPIVTSNDSLLVAAGGYTYELMQLDLRTRRAIYFGRQMPPRRRTPIELAESQARWAGGIVGPGGQTLRSPVLQAKYDRLATDTLPHFRPGGLSLVGNTLLVVGQANDSGFVDMFRGGAFIGRSIIPCATAASPSIAWPWLAVLCTIPEDSDGRKVDVRRFRLGMKSR